MRKQILIPFLFFGSVLTAAPNPTIVKFKGVSESDQSPCVVQIYKDGETLLGFRAQGHGVSHEGHFYLVPDEDSNQVKIDVVDVREFQAESSISVAFRKSKNWFSPGYQYVSHIKMTSSNNIVTMRAKLTLQFFGDESNPAKIRVASDQSGFARSYSNMTCIIRK